MENLSPKQLEVLNAVKDLPEIQALIKSAQITTPHRRSFPGYQGSLGYQGSPGGNYHSRYTRPNQQVYNRLTSPQGYSPKQMGYSPRGYSPMNTSHNMNTSWHAFSPTRFRQSPLRQIDLMITYIENATTFWAQVLHGDIVNMSLKLEEDLKKECPTLPPVVKVGKGHVYGTLWDGAWYRCISCGPPDPNEMVDVLFVDYGNKEKKHLNELVWLKTPTFTDVPFFASPFILPGLEPVPEFAEQAISLFSTNETLQGFVNCIPKCEEFCAIQILRPQTDELEPQLRTYNTLMVHKGYAKSSTEGPNPPPTCYYMIGLQRRLHYMSNLLREKEHIVTTLGKELVGLRGGNISKTEDVDEADIVPEMVLESLPRAPRTVSEVPVVEEVKLQKVDEEKDTDSSEDVDILDEISPLSHTIDPVSGSNGQELFIKLFNEAELYRAIVSSTELKDEFLRLAELYKGLSDNVLPKAVAEKRKGVVDIELRLESSQQAIRDCHRKDLQALVETRDNNVTSLTSIIQDYIGAVKECNGELLLHNIENIMLELAESNVDHINVDYTTTEGAFEVLAELCSKYTILKESSMGEISELVDRLCSNWEMEFKMLQDIGSANTEQGNWTAKEAANVVEETFAVTHQLLNSFNKYRNIASDENNEKIPMSFSIKSLILAHARRQYKHIKPLLGGIQELGQRAKQLSSFITDKPDITILTTLKTEIRAARRSVKLAQIESNSDDEGDNSDNLREAMRKLHDLYEKEESSLLNIVSLAQSPYPELLINHQQLKNIISGEDIVKSGWEINHFVLPDTDTCINSSKQNVIEGFYRDEVSFFIEYNLQNSDMTLEEEAIKLIKNKLNGCFAIFIDSKRLRAYGCTKSPPF